MGAAPYLAGYFLRVTAAGVLYATNRKWAAAPFELLGQGLMYFGLFLGV